MAYFPVYLDLQNRRVAVVGGSEETDPKAEALFTAGACVVIFASRLGPRMRGRAEHPRVVHHRRDFRAGDLEGCILVVADRDDEARSAAIFREAEARGIPCNVVDDLRYCSFIYASVLRQGDLTITISTGGKAPALAVRLRQRLEKWLGPHYARFLELAGRLRRPLAERYDSFEERRALWYRLVDSDVLELLDRGDEAAAHRRIVEIAGVSPETSP